MTPLQRTCIILVATTAALAGCGQTTPGVYDPNNPYGSGYVDPSTGTYVDPNNPYGSSSQYGTDTSGTPAMYGNGTYGSGAVPAAPVATGSANMPTGTGTAASTAPTLTLGPITKHSSGFWLWQHLEADGQVTNSSNAVLSGEVQLSFMKKGRVVETQYEFVTDLAPGQSHTFTLKSKKSADDAQGSVSSEPGNTQANPYGSSTYGSPYGSSSGSTYGSTYGSGYDNTGGYPTSTTGSYPTGGYGY